jgi:hypothetical protein
MTLGCYRSENAEPQYKPYSTIGLASRLVVAETNRPRIAAAEVPKMAYCARKVAEIVHFQRETLEYIKIGGWRHEVGT